MIDATLIINENKPIANGVYIMRLTGDFGTIMPGQFVNIKLPGLYLRRPISVADVNANTLTLIYKVVGEGTAAMAECIVGDRLSVLCGLGNGFNITNHKNPLLIGGGVGTPPMLMLAKTLWEMGTPAVAVLGFRSQGDVFLESELAAVTKNVYIATEDGSYGTKGYVTDVVNSLDYDYFYACGPMPMLRALSSLEVDGQLSFEERMGCGFGGCMGCSCKKTNDDYARICKEGPVFKKGEIKI